MLLECSDIADTSEGFVEANALEKATMELSKLMRCAITDGCAHASTCRDRIDGLLQRVQHSMRDQMTKGS
jgi:hypothetical protein